MRSCAGIKLLTFLSLLTSMTAPSGEVAHIHLQIGFRQICVARHEIPLWLLRGHAESRYEQVQGEGMTKAVLGIVGGSGIYDLPGLENAREEAIRSPWGEPSAQVRRGSIEGLPIVFLPRHDKGHRLSPSDINYRANIDVLKRAGVTDLISLSACGSF